MAAHVDDPGSTRDPSGRRLAYLPAAVLGNGSLLVTLSARGEIERILWPHVDGPDNVRTLRLGLAGPAGVCWLDEHAEGWSQTWEGDASVLRTTVSLGGQTAEIVDAVDPDEPVLVRRVVSEPAVLVVSVEPSLEGTERPTGAFVDPATRIVVLHRRRAAIALAVDRPGAKVEVRSAGGVGGDMAHVAPIAARVEVGYEGVTHLVVALGAGPFEALDRARRHVALAASAAARRGAADERLLSRTAVGSGSTDLDRALQRSVLVLAQLADRTTGGVVAAPEMDEGFVESGGYGFVWPRDLAYVVLGLLAAGCDDLAVAALRWLARTQAPEGLWLHRYWTTGEPAPSWGLHQIDETGVVLVAAEAAFRELGDEALDAGLWPVVRSAADLLVSFVDPATSLPLASIDLWEQHDAQHAYSGAAVVGGLRAAALTAERHEPALGDVYARASSEIAAALDRHLWDDSLGRYRRAVSLGRTDRSGGPVGSAFDRSLPYPNRRVRSMDEADPRLDSALLGLAWPFAPFGGSAERVRATVDAVERGLATPEDGLRRHEGDTYGGGYEWPLARLWLGLARRALGDDEAASRAVAQVVGRRTALDLLPEQVRPDGSPAWVLPLGWSHAMLLVAARPELKLIRMLREEDAGDGRGG